jgi:CRP-like cAMP-binding protein
MPKIIETKVTHEKIAIYEDDEFVFVEGDTSRDLFIIQEGEVEIIKQSERGELKLAVFKRGDFFGDMALLQGGHRFAGARAKGKTKLLILQPGGFLLKIRRDPTFAFEMLQALSMRIKVSNERLLHLIQKGNIPQDLVNEILQMMGER